MTLIFMIKTDLILRQTQDDCHGELVEPSIFKLSHLQIFKFSLQFKFQNKRSAFIFNTFKINRAIHQLDIFSNNVQS